MDIIIIGAGAAGLMAAKELSAAGMQVCVLEARPRLGGRIHTLEQNEYLIDAGAEFIHGNLEVTLALLNEAAFEKQLLTGEMWQVTNGKWSRGTNFFEYFDQVYEKLALVKEDMSITAFLNKYFQGTKYTSLRRSLTSYVEGYYSGEISKTSTLSFFKELKSEDDRQFKPVGGYGRLIQYLADEAKKAGTEIHTEAVVQEVRWSEGQVEVRDALNRSFHAKKVMISVPVGVWTAAPAAVGKIEYIPALPRKIEAANQLGFGSVVKILLQFDETFYQDQILKNQDNADISRFQMVISEEPIPTWWTQYPQSSPLLTGWLSGPAAAQMKDEPDQVFLSKSLYSLGNIFKIDEEILRSNLAWWNVFNWTSDPFTRGSYSYSTLQTANARKELMEPVKNTLFFAGEALYDGPEMGTVEAALTSGKEVALKILQQ